MKKDKIEHMFQSDFGDRPAPPPSTTTTATAAANSSSSSVMISDDDDDEGEGYCDTQDSTVLPFSQSQTQPPLSQQSIPISSASATAPTTTAPTSSSGIVSGSTAGGGVGGVGAKRRKLSQNMYKLLMSKDPKEKLA